LSLVGSHSGIEIPFAALSQLGTPIASFSNNLRCWHFSRLYLRAAALAINAIGMETRHKILVLDDDADWLNLCNEMFAQLPSKPEIRTVASGARAWRCWKPSRSGC
jgi:hypothetical protein